MIKFKEIEIVGLFGETDVKFNIEGNRIIIVGYNGIGKSTVLNCFYYLISQQWSKLQENDFGSISIRVRNNNRKLTVQHSDIEEYLRVRRRMYRNKRYTRRFSSSFVMEAERLLSQRARQITPELRGQKSGYQIRENARLLQNRLGLSLSAAEEIAREHWMMSQPELEFDSPSYNRLSNVSDFLDANLKGRILYLPTYRRIEKDIKTVFPEIEEELQRTLTRRRGGTTTSENYLELVQFGMEDVKQNLDMRLESVKAYALSQINSLTTKYLRDVIRDEAKDYDEIKNSEISKTALDSVFSKVDSALLSDQDKKKIEGVVKKINSNSDLLENEKYVAHYVHYLVEIGDKISRREAPIWQFVEICNSYLFGKSFSFDNVAYNVDIYHHSKRPVKLEQLSSGEKQIVSLFSHLLLDQDVANYVVIDEPELSLSVDWQQRFLEDISKLPTCAFIGAVTHSPFIFENSLDANTVDLLGHASPTQ